MAKLAHKAELDPQETVVPPESMDLLDLLEYLAQVVEMDQQEHLEIGVNKDHLDLQAFAQGVLSPLLVVVL